MESSYDLYDVVQGVPAVMRPVYWEGERSTKDNLNTLEMWRGEYSRLLPPGATIDEAAVMVPSLWHSHRFIDSMVADGWESFNAANDIVYVNPFGTRYLVRYEFLRHEDKSYRLEVMHMEFDDEGREGFSPLHQALWTPGGSAPATAGVSRYPVPHLSFKAPRNSGDLQLRSAYSRAVAHLQAKGCIHAQTCQSTYGVFGYYLPHDAGRQLYLKPRTNLRDEP